MRSFTPKQMILYDWPSVTTLPTLNLKALVSPQNNTRCGKVKHHDYRIHFRISVNHFKNLEKVKKQKREYNLI